MRIPAAVFAAALSLSCGPALAGEESDFGVPPTRALRLADHASPTPREIPGARTISTPQLQAWLKRDAAARPVLFDVVGGEEHESIPDAVWLPGAGRGSGFDDALQGRLARELATYGSRPLVFFCASTHCWLSYNAALRALALGYREVFWYRGGIESWLDAGGDLSPMQRTWQSRP